jgi:hypothetical protein
VKSRWKFPGIPLLGSCAVFPLPPTHTGSMFFNRVAQMSYTVPTMHENRMVHYQISQMENGIAVHRDHMENTEYLKKLLCSLKIAPQLKMQEFWLSFWSQELSPYCQSEVPSCL